MSDYRASILALAVGAAALAGCEGLDSAALAICGNGKVERAEACDDGFRDQCGSCNADCSAPGSGSVCGDANVCPETEACDDGFEDECGSCNADCSAPGSGSVCGDGTFCPETEACDDGFNDACGSCNTDCSRPGSGSVCGDANVCPETETCDDGFNDACGGCNTDCTAPGTGSVCGDANVCPETEACDDGFNDACGGCNTDCTAPGTGSVCGDANLCPETEACDDGFNDACGSCNANCTAHGSGSVCGDANVCPETEACDDGFNDACGSCNTDCTAGGSGHTCGDGAWCPELERCDGPENCYLCTPVVFVDADAGNGGDGASWATAFSFLQDGLKAALATGGPVEIWVAEGTYYPDDGADLEPGDWNVSFSLRNGIALYGGFSGAETSRSERNWTAHRTVLSGDLLRDDEPGVVNRTDNSCHVVKTFNTDSTARLDGFVVNSGHALSCATQSGGGLLMGSSSATIANTEFSGNFAFHGGGISALGGGPTISNCRFEHNGASDMGGALHIDNYNHNGHGATLGRLQIANNAADRGGGVASIGTVAIVDSVFLANHASSRGGGLSSELASSGWTAVAVNTRFIGNVAGSTGGGAWVSSDLQLVGCVFSGNSARYGGGVGGGTIVNSTLVGNSASEIGGGAYYTRSVQNSIAVGNTPDQVARVGDRSVTYSCVEGGVSGTGNLDDCAPLFVDADGADDIPGTLDDDLRLQSGSAGVDAGSNYALPDDEFDIDGDGDRHEPLPFDANGSSRLVDAPAPDTGNGAAPLVDIGAFEVQ